MVKIGLLIPSLQSGGMERVMSELVQYFTSKEGVEIHLILYGKNRDIFYPIPDSIKIYRPDFHFSDYSRFISTLKSLSFVRSIVKHIQPDTILSLGEYWNNFVLLALKGLKFPVFISDRCQPDKSLGFVQDLLRKWLYPNAAGIIAQTTKAKEVYQQQKLNNNITVIGNPIHEITQNGSKYEKENIVLSVGRLIETKHHDRLIKIFKETSSEGWKLVIVGGDALKQRGMKKLRKLVERLGMNDVVEFTGTVSDIESYYRKSKVFAFTSSSEGFPNAIGEAMSAGLPIIAYDCIAGPSDMIEDEKNGYLIPLFDDKKYSKKLKSLLNDEKLRQDMGEISKKLVNEFSVRNIGEKYFSFITSGA